MKQSTILIATTMIVAFTTAPTLAESKPTHLSRTADISFIREANADTNESFLKATSRPTKQHLDDLRSKDVITLSVPFRHQAIKIDLHKTSALTVVNECEIIDGTTAGNTCSTQASFFVGGVPGDPGVNVFLGIAGNQVAGYAEMGDKLEVLATTAQGFKMRGDLQDQESRNLQETFCGVDDARDDFSDESQLGADYPAAAGGATTPMHRLVELSIDIAPDVIAEFPTTCDAWDYVALVHGAVGDVSKRDLAVEIDIAACRLWEITPPWEYSTCCNQTPQCVNETGCDECLDGGFSMTELNRFRDYWSNCGSGLPRQDGHFLVTFHGASNIGLGGAAFTGSICGFPPCCSDPCNNVISASAGYAHYNLGFTSQSFPDLRDPRLAAHEIGHMLGARHADAAPVGGSIMFGTDSPDNFYYYIDSQNAILNLLQNECCDDEIAISVGDYDHNGVIDSIDRLACVDCTVHNFSSYGCDAVFGDATIDTAQDGLTYCDCDTWWATHSDPIDCNNNGTPDGCEVDAGTATDCNNNGILDDCLEEPDGDCDGDGTLDICEDSSEITMHVAAEGSRFIRVEVDAPPCLIFRYALRVANFENLVFCPPMYVQEDGLLDLNPVFQTPAEWGVVYIHGEEIVPSTLYVISMEAPTDARGTWPEVHPDFPEFDGTAVTGPFGDADNDGDVDDDDVTAAIAGYGGTFEGNASFYTVNIDPCEPTPGMQIQTEDILEVIHAVGGGAYTDECTIPNCNP